MEDKRMGDPMRVLGKRKKNIILEVTPKEMDTITTALGEWAMVEEDTMKPDKSFDKLERKIYKEQGRFESLTLLNQKQLERLGVKKLEKKDT
jgi:hypothetical protein